MAEARPAAHPPPPREAGALGRRSQDPTEVASGAPLLVDVEVGHGRTIYALSQGTWTWPDRPENAGLPASPNTGALVKADHGSLTTVLGGLDRPTSFELVGDTAFVVTLTGTVIRIDNV